LFFFFRDLIETIGNQTRYTSKLQNAGNQVAHPSSIVLVVDSSKDFPAAGNIAAPGLDTLIRNFTTGAHSAVNSEAYSSLFNSLVNQSNVPFIVLNSAGKSAEALEKEVFSAIEGVSHDFTL
jgi:hypothetical protein